MDTQQTTDRRGNWVEAESDLVNYFADLQHQNATDDDLRVHALELLAARLDRRDEKTAATRCRVLAKRHAQGAEDSRVDAEAAAATGKVPPYALDFTGHKRRK